MSRFLKEEEARQALIDPSSTTHMMYVTMRVMTAAAGEVRGVSSPFTIEDYRMVLEDSRVTLSPRGPKKVLQERVYEHRDHIANVLQLSLEEIERMPDSAERTKACFRSSLERGREGEEVWGGRKRVCERAFHIHRCRRRRR